MDDNHIYYKNAEGLLHREDGPAIIYISGHKEWYFNGFLHRKDGPAIEYPDGSKHWCQYGELHREDGPAIISYNGKKEWWFKNKQISCSSQEEFEKLVKLKVFW